MLMQRTAGHYHFHELTHELARAKAGEELDRPAQLVAPMVSSVGDSGVNGGHGRAGLS
jgi:hypothetical protein